MRSEKAESVSSCHSVRSLALWITPKSTVFYGQVCVAATLPHRPPTPPYILSCAHTNYQVAVNCILRLCSAQLLLILVASQWNQSYINCTNNSAHSLCNGQASSTSLPPFPCHHFPSLLHWRSSVAAKLKTKARGTTTKAKRIITLQLTAMPAKIDRDRARKRERETAKDCEWAGVVARNRSKGIMSQHNCK